MRRSQAAIAFYDGLPDTLAICWQACVQSQECIIRGDEAVAPVVRSHPPCAVSVLQVCTCVVFTCSATHRRWSSRAMGRVHVLWASLLMNRARIQSPTVQTDFSCFTDGENHENNSRSFFLHCRFYCCNQKQYLLYLKIILFITPSPPNHHDHHRRRRCRLQKSLLAYLNWLPVLLAARY